MKKFLTSVAMVLLLVGCAKQYDDTAIQTRIADLERRVTALESSVDALRSAIGEGVFVAKVQEYADPETGKTIGVTVTYTNGDVKYFEINPKADYDGPVVSIISNGAGELVWAVDGVAIQVSGQDVTVYQTPVFTIDDEGYLWVEINGEKVQLGQVQNSGATLEDGIFTNIQVLQDKIVLTLSDESTVNIPFAEAFKLNIETTEYCFTELAPIEIPYTVSAKTEGTVVGVAGYSPKQFSVQVEDEKIVVTPLSMKASAILLAYADSKVGLTSVVNITVEAEGVEVVDTPFSADVDYMADGDNATVTANVVSNVDFDVKPVEEWIHVVDVKAQAYVITLSLEDNTTGDFRTGSVNIVKKGTDTVLQTIKIGQNIPDPIKNLSKKESANCYIISAPGDYKFAAVKGNSAESVGTVAYVKTLWETLNTEVAPEPGAIIADYDYIDGFVYLTTPAELTAGNAVIAAYDASDNIIWSWHIWVPATEIETNTYGIYNVPMMDRNLGALVAANAAEVAPVESYGLFYQWGRKDPFPGPKSNSSSSFAALTNNLKPQHLEGDGATDACKITLEQSIQNPLLMGRSNSGDWITPSDNNLWVDEAKTMYDPCPPGYRVPARLSDQPLHGSDYTAVTGWSESAANKLFTMGEPAAVFPFAGYLDDYGPADGISKNGLRVIYWTAHKNSDIAGYCMNVRETVSGGNAHKLSSAGKARGGCVRCVADVVAE